MNKLELTNCNEELKRAKRIDEVIYSEKKLCTFAA
jgi:hypothetical protein